MQTVATPVQVGRRHPLDSPRHRACRGVLATVAYLLGVCLGFLLLLVTLVLPGE